MSLEKDNQTLLMSVMKKVVYENPLLISQRDEVVSDFHKGVEEVLDHRYEVVMPT